MTSPSLGIFEAIEIAMDAEKKAQLFYSDAAKKVANERGKNLLKQLADFEQNHYDRLQELKTSLTTSGKYINYAGTVFKQYRAEISAVIEQDRQGVLDILQLAIDAETKAKEHYLKMVKQTTDKQGKKMFEKLAAEEDMHRRILNDEFYNLSNVGGTWAWGE